MALASWTKSWEVAFSVLASLRYVFARPTDVRGLLPFYSAGSIAQNVEREIDAWTWGVYGVQFILDASD